MTPTEVTVLVDPGTGLVQSVSGAYWGEYRPSPQTRAVETVAKALWEQGAWAGRPVPFSDEAGARSGWRAGEPSRPGSGRGRWWKGRR
ncbi:hypothetical protein [Kineococcus rhizosphaerae]|uniref:Uncharacterized protein n=1 Tax=Kineococcus rhizosphaerae TaxID=559628 RepID=A0A2T0R4E3_9ACTN|nr:hypothetical protein [Kineococcus rhizosphaerae]PRY15238.1 hypothetical protein CLV37_105164 [Kineococcus rhizosphaerae]